MNWADLLQGTGRPVAQGYSSYQPESAPFGTEVSSQKAEGLDIWQQFMTNPKLRQFLLNLLMKNQGMGV